VIALPHRQRRSDGLIGSTESASRNLVLRTISAAVLAPIVIAVAYVGGWPFLILCALAAGGILWEWVRLVAGRSDPAMLLPGIAALLAALTMAAFNRDGAAAGVIGAGALLAAALTTAYPRDHQAKWSGVWAAGGVAYAGAAFIGPALLRRDGQLGFLAIVFLAATVWTTDILAYLFGRTLGGPLLWPKVSPKKTWSGALGGLAGGVAGGTAVAYASASGRLAPVAITALVLSALAQAGDLFESAVKRRFGAKDASQLIPGHGGLMDRLDGFLIAALAALVIGIIRQGTGAPARGLLVW
jgi:phosphatidate cytidylyltransferase